MFAQFQSYIIAGLVVILLTVGGAFWMYHKSSVAETAILRANVAKYEVVVQQQEKTIKQMIADAKRLAEANAALADAQRKTEQDFVDEWKAIDALDLKSKANTEELERKINDEFQKSIDGLRNATGGGKSDRMRND